MSRFYVEERLDAGKSVVVRGSEARHIKDVLRLKAGAPVFLFDGSGAEFEGKISGIGRDNVSIDVIDARKREAEFPVEVILAQGIPKSDKMDLIVQKSTELGVLKIVPLYTERVIPMSFSLNRLNRWKRIAIEACKQSGRVRPPTISQPVRFEEFVADADPLSLKLIPWEAEKNTSLKDVLPPFLKSVSLVVGPEGGFSETEIRLAKENGFVPVSLGRRVLRTETVSLSVISVIQYLYGDLAG